MKRQLAIVIGGLSFMTLVLYAPEITDSIKELTRPKFKVGDCVIPVKPDTESWEERNVFIERIEEIGKKKYRTSFYFNGTWLHVGTEIGDSIKFSHANYYKKVECPK